jgi:hypothetical protein
MFGFLIAIAIGFAVPHLETPVVTPLAKAMERHVRLEPGEGRVLAYALALIIAGLIAVLLGSSNAFWVPVGALLGYFATRIVAAVRDIIEARQS